MNTQTSGARESLYPGFVRLHEPRIRAFVARRALEPSDLDDIVQEVFLVAWRRFDHLRKEVPETSHLAWLCGTALRVQGHGSRAKERRRRYEGRYGSDRSMNQSDRRQRDGFGTVEERDLVDRALTRLREADRQVLLAVLWDGFTAGDVAVMLGITETAARQRIARAYRRVRKGVDE